MYFEEVERNYQGKPGAEEVKKSNEEYLNYSSGSRSSMILAERIEQTSLRHLCDEPLAV